VWKKLSADYAQQHADAGNKQCQKGQEEDSESYQVHKNVNQMTIPDA